MEIFKEAQTAVNFASYYSILHKATADNETPCPGYVYEEIIKLSYVSEGHRAHLVDFLLSRLQVSGCCGKQKVVTVLRHLTQKAHPATRNLLRLKDTQLREMGGPTHGLQSGPSMGGVQSPMQQLSNTSSYMVVNAKTPQLLLHSAVQELLAELFDPQLIRADEEKMRQGDCRPSLSNASAQSGMGSSAASGPSSALGGGTTKYQGFGSSAFTSSPTVINKVRGLVDRILWPDVKELSPTAKAILKPNHGSYVPFEIPKEYLNEIAPCFNSGGGGGGLSVSMYSSTGAQLGGSGSTDGRGSAMGRSAVGSKGAGGGPGSSGRGNSPRMVTGRTHRAGQAGGGWEDEELDDDEEKEESSSCFGEQPYSFRDTASLPPLSNLPDTTINPPVQGSQTERLEDATVQEEDPIAQREDLIVQREETDRSNHGVSSRSRSSSTVKEVEFLKEFLNVCSSWPVPYDTFIDISKTRSLLNPEGTLQEIAALFYKENTRFNRESEGGGNTSDSSVPSPRSTSLPHHHQMALLTFVDLAVHDDVFSPIDVRDALALVLEMLQEDPKADAVVRTRAKRLALVTDKLVQICERRDA